MPDRYVAACRWAARVLPLNRESGPQGDWRGGASAALAEARLAMAALPGGAKRNRQERRVRVLERRSGVERRRGEDSRLAQALEFAGLAVQPDEVRALARLLGSLLGIFAFTGIAVTSLLSLPLFVAPAWLALPLLGYAAVLGYPETLAKRAKLRGFRETPEVANYLAMSLRVHPSLDRAIAFAAEHGDGLLAGGLRRVLWDVHLRTRVRIEDSFLAFADSCGTWTPEMKRALYVLAHAARQGSQEGIPRAIDRALSVVYEGTRRRFQDFAAALRGPTTALFALGVLLPLIVGSMVPMLSLGGFSPTSVRAARPSPGDPLPWIVLLDVVFPVATFAFAHQVSSGFPGRAASGGRGVWRRPFALLFLAPAPVVVALAFPNTISPLAALGAIIVLVAAVLYAATRAGVVAQKRADVLERAFPDALFLLGSRLGEGRGLEDAFVAVSDGLRGTAIRDLFVRIACAVRLGGDTIEAALFGDSGALRDTPSAIRAALKMVVDLAAKNPEVAGRAALEMSAHLRDLQGLRQDLHAELQPTVDAMRATTTFFAPVVLGVTATLYGLLANAFSGVASLPMPPSLFQIALGVYLALATVAILHFVARIEPEGNVATLGASLARSLPVGYGLFAATILLAGIML